MSWYGDLDTMERDDRHLNGVYDRLLGELSPEARGRVAGVHVYPSLRCTYTIDKRRIFVRVRDERGDAYPECVLRHVILHELAHVANPTVGHDGGFRRWLAWMLREAGPRAAATLCAHAVPLDFNPCR